MDRVIVFMISLPGLLLGDIHTAWKTGLKCEGNKKILPDRANALDWRCTGQAG
jgi:hypothetical protein